MDALQTNWTKPTLSESSVVLVGLLFAVVGLTFQDSVGVSSLLLALGIGLVVAGTVYLTVEGSAAVRLSLTFLALVALPLLFFGGLVRLLGVLGIGAVLVGALYSRRSH
ncbi:hypothetical protein L593_11740 [Salinarchaeum sp. Harcht-Bsk1]|uniref:hypothetical protein n=1 Tax=Salinarchaeum sp. Harcht-Bsk1 TaxID=1333523 RepID=UPI00034232EB|nr:hypothetical protein [Salinarchaeum sp. Harcht-Bsk1]AGN02291.1 hypothetical protein L593_11740 [Salinarchaeum sp. Harcht-Bsk1]